MATNIILADQVGIQPTGRFSSFAYTLPKPANFVVVVVQRENGTVVWEETLAPGGGRTHWPAGNYDYAWNGRGFDGRFRVGQFLISMAANVEGGANGNGNGDSVPYGLIAALVGAVLIFKGGL